MWRRDRLVIIAVSDHETLTQQSHFGHGTNRVFTKPRATLNSMPCKGRIPSMPRVTTRSQFRVSVSSMKNRWTQWRGVQRADEK